MVNSNCIKSMNKKPVLHDDHDYCAANVTRKNAYNKEHNFDRKSKRHATDRSSIQSCTGEDWKKIIAREIIVDKVQYLFLSEEQMREKVYRKFEISAVMGDVLSRASTIFSGTIPEISKDSPEGGNQTSTEMLELNEIVEPEDIKEFSSQENRCLGLLDEQRRSPEQNETEDSGIPPTTSELSQSITPDLKFPCPTTMESQTSQRVDPIDPLPNLVSSNSTIYSQPTQLPTQNFRLPSFQQTFGSRTPSNVSICSQQYQSDTPKYPSSGTPDIVGPGLSDGDAMDPDLMRHFYRSPPSHSQTISGSDPRGVEHLKTYYENFSSYDFPVTQSTGQQFDTQIALNSEPQNENTDSNESSLTLSIPITMDMLENQNSAESELSDFTFSSVSSFKLSDTQEALDSEPQNGNTDSNGFAQSIPMIMDVSENRKSVDSVTSEITNLTALSFMLFDTENGVIGKERMPNYSPDHQDFDENLIENHEQSPWRQQGGKRILEPESLYTDTEESCNRESHGMMTGNCGSSKVVENPCEIIDLISRETGSSEMETANNGDCEVSEVLRKPYNFSVDTKLSPSFLPTRKKGRNNVSLDHSYSGQSSILPSFHNLEELEGDGHNLSATKNDDLEVFPELSGKDHNYVKNIYHGRVRKVNRSNVCYEDKENSFARNSSIDSNQNPVARTLRFDLNGSEGSDDLQSPEVVPAKKKMRLRSPGCTKCLPTARRSNIANRDLTPYYAEHRNTNFRVLTPFYRQEKNAEYRVSTPFNSCSQRKKPEVIDLTSDTEDERTVQDFPIDVNINVKCEGTESNLVANLESQTSFQNVEDDIGSRFVMSEELPILENFPNHENIISQLLNSDSAVNGPVVTELFSNRCCEYDHFLDINSMQILTYKPRLLKHLFDQSDEVITQGINDALRLLDDC